MNYYSKVSACQAIKCSPVEFGGLQKLLGDPEGDEHHGAVYLHSDNNGQLDALPKAFLKEFGRLIAANKLRYLGFGMAYSADRNIPDSHSGGFARIYANGDVVFPRLVWPRK